MSIVTPLSVAVKSHLIYPAPLSPLRLDRSSLHLPHPPSSLHPPPSSLEDEIQICWIIWKVISTEKIHKTCTQITQPRSAKAQNIHAYTRTRASVGTILGPVFDSMSFSLFTVSVSVHVLSLQCKSLSFSPRTPLCCFSLFISPPVCICCFSLHISPPTPLCCFPLCISPPVCLYCKFLLSSPPARLYGFC